eukprot:01558.XXX_5062_5696_1 [CDS] Oithona nana genome sequencing.
MGSALLGKRKRAINYPDVTKYLKQKFDAGKGGAKFKPTTVERMMRQEFPVEKLKSATEIKNIFSRFTLQEKGNKDPTEEEIEEASAELDAIYESDVIAEIDKKLESSKDGIYLSGHTLQVDGVNLCGLMKDFCTKKCIITDTALNSIEMPSLKIIAKKCGINIQGVRKPETMGKKLLAFVKTKCGCLDMS